LRALYISVAALALLALAFFLRVFRLGDKNVWWDEGWTVWLAKHDFAWIALRTASDEHPPLHYWLMNVWQNVFGADVFTGRFFSLLFGVLLVAVIYRLGKEMGGARVGLLAALFLALARFNVWWSQDIKNYTLSAFFAWGSVWCVWRIIFFESKFRRNFDSKKIIFLFYIFSSALALYSHYLAALILLANNVFVFFFLAAKWRRGENFVPLLMRWSIAQIAVVILFAPWLYVYLQNGATWSAAPAFDFGLFLQLAATVLTLGVTTYIENFTWIVFGLLVFAGMSLGWIFSTFHVSRFTLHASRSTLHTPLSPLLKKAWATFYVLLITLLPPALIYLLSLTPAAIFAPKIQARYLMMLTPAIALLLALGVMFVAENLRAPLSKFVAGAMVLFIVAAQIFTLNNYFQERILRDEYLTVAQMINNFGFDDDAIVLNTDQEYPTFLYYLKRDFDWIGVPNGAQVNEATARRVAADALQHRAVWVVTIPDALQKDPTRLIEQKIAERLPKQYEQTFGDKRLALYADTIRNVKDVPRENFSPQIFRNDVFDERLKLVGVDLPVRETLAGDVVRVVTYWEAHDLTTINVSLQKDSGAIVARLAVPISIGAHERAQTNLQIPPYIQSEYLHVVAQARLNSLSIGTIRVTPRPGVKTDPLINVQTSPQFRFGEHIRLYTLGSQGMSARGDQAVPVTLYWTTDAPLDTSYKVFVHLLGTQYNAAQNNFLWGQVDRLPLDGQLPTTAWIPAQVVIDQYEPTLQTNAPPGLYKIEIGLYDANGARLRVFDAQDNDLGDALIIGTVVVE